MDKTPTCESELTVEQRALLHSFPVLSEEDLEAVNSLYKHYIFYEKVSGGRKLHTSCCHREGDFYPDLVKLDTEEHREFVASGHNAAVVCPYCGKNATLKSIEKSKKCISLQQSEEVVFLHCVNGELYAQAYWTNKRFGAGYYSQEPYYMTSIVYHFCKGKASMFYMQYGTWYCIEQVAPLRGRLKIIEPFRLSGIYSSTLKYYVINHRCLAQSDFKYCHPETWDKAYRPVTGKTVELMKYLTICCMYPEKIEMLRKKGMIRVIEDLMRGKKNAAAINWDEPNPYKSFGLNKRELREFMETADRDVDMIAAYKKIKKLGGRTSMTQLSELWRSLGSRRAQELLQYAGKYRQAPERVLRYLDKFTGGCHAGGYRSVGSIYQHWKDYLDAAAELGYDMGNPVVICPKDLQARHDEATGELRRRLELAKSEERRRREEEIRAGIKKRGRRYDFVLGEYFIRVAESSDEIIREGQELNHCVAGYGGRHEDGKLTICFLRRADAPNVSLVTIEMHGKRLIQIHGHDNERSACTENPERVSPRELYAGIVEPWLKWIGQGSKRNKAGEPIIPGGKKKKAEVGAA